MQEIALYNRQGKRLLTLKEAGEKGYGSVYFLKQRIRRGKIKGYKVGRVWLILETGLSRPEKRRPGSHRSFFNRKRRVTRG